MDLRRREFLKAALAIPVGIAEGILEVPVDTEIMNATEHLTAHPAGNAGYAETQACQDAPRRAGCSPSDVPPPPTLQDLTVVYPLFEEPVFRVIPSVAIDALDHKPIEEIAHNVRVGADQLRPTRKEVIAGGVSSLLFGYAHNVTPHGFDTRFVPTPQVFGGLMLWSLQRRLGFLSNFFAHASFNGYAYSMINRKS